MRFIFYATDKSILTKFFRSPYNMPWKPRGVSEGTALLVNNFVAKNGVGSQHHAPAALPQEKGPCIHLEEAIIIYLS
jgi:hypothetical protein